jgi:predicted nuclease of predicted toxin-antitoxin system
MRLKIDENLPADLADLLVQHGHDAHSVYDEGLQGNGDEIVAERCRLEGRAILTLDLGFGDIRAYPPEKHPGLIVLRLSDQSRPHVLRMMEPVLKLLSSTPVEGRLWVVTEGGVRVRGPDLPNHPR